MHRLKICHPSWLKKQERVCSLLWFHYLWLKHKRLWLKAVSSHNFEDMAGDRSSDRPGLTENQRNRKRPIVAISLFFEVGLQPICMHDQGFSLMIKDSWLTILFTSIMSYGPHHDLRNLGYILADVSVLELGKAQLEDIRYTGKYPAISVCWPFRHNFGKPRPLCEIPCLRNEVCWSTFSDNRMDSWNVYRGRVIQWVHALWEQKQDETFTFMLTTDELSHSFR